MNCWKCGASLHHVDRKISFRAICDQCGTSLHCCKNCLNYAPGKPNDCAVPGTEYIPDREANNFCEEFEFLGKPPPVKPPQGNRKAFDDLFN